MSSVVEELVAEVIDALIPHLNQLPLGIAGLLPGGLRDE